MYKKNMMFLALIFVVLQQSWSEDCGKEGRGANRISGGNTTHPNKYPWMVYFNFFDEDSNNLQCGGSLISDRHVLTAKHCTNNVVLYTPMKVGVHDIQDSEDYQEIEIEKAILPEDNPLDHDIAILLLKIPVDLEDPKIGIVCLPEMENEDYIGKEVKAMGWGMENRNDWGRLKDVNLEVIDEEDNYIYTKVNKINGVYQDPCEGDSGGPLVYKKANRWTVIGTVHGGGYSCDTGLTDGNQAFSRVTAHLKWIKCIIGNTESGDEKQEGVSEGTGYCGASHSHCLLGSSPRICLH